MGPTRRCPRLPPPPPLPEESVSRTVPLDVLKQMLRRETELRLAPETQRAYEESHVNDPDGSKFFGVTEGLQRRVVAEFGFADHAAELALFELRTCALQYPDDPDIRSIPIFVKYNRCHEGALRVGAAAPDVPLWAVEGDRRFALSEVLQGTAEGLPEGLRGAAPLLVVSGSYTWPPFRQLVAGCHELQAKYAGRLRCCFVYILEAHAEDEWPIGGEVKYEQPTTLAERCAIAREFIAGMDVTVPVLVDGIEADLQRPLDDTSDLGPPQTFQELYAGWPIRLYVIDAVGTILVRPDPKDCGFTLTEIDEWAAAHC